MIRFAAPLLLALALPLVALLAWRLRRLPGHHRGARRRLIQATMLLGALGAALALGELELGRRMDRLAVIFVLDRSRSVERSDQAQGDEALASMRETLETMRSDDRAGLVVFGAEATTELLPAARPQIATERAPVPKEGTDIGAGIRRALADLPEGYVGRLVLISDGIETDGDSLQAVSSAVGRGVVLDVMPIEREPRPEVAIARVHAPATAQPDEPVDLRIVTRATAETAVRVRVRRDGELLAEGETRVGAGEDVRVLRDHAPGPGVHRYEVLVEALDPAADVAQENNEGGALMRVLGGTKALVLASEPEEARALADAVRAAGLEVRLAGPEGVPATLAQLASYDLLILSDLDSRAFTPLQMRAIHAYVRELGGGLLMVGARRSFGLGGYAHTPIEEALPATFDLRRRRDRLSLGMVIAIDKSGSMSVEVSAGTTKLDLANEAAARSALLLAPSDRVGVMHVDTEVSWTQPMIAVADPAQIAARCRAAGPGGGGILVDITLEAAYAALRAEPTQLKHLLLFSDGQDSEDMRGTRAMVQAAARDRITTSVVSMGTGPDTPELEQLSRIGGGRFYIVEDMRELPRIFTQETIEASRAALREEPFRASVATLEPIVEGLDFGSSPPLGGHAIVSLRPGGTEVLHASEEDPLLARWQHGIGRSAVFTTDAGAELGRPWLEWPGYGVLFSQLARDLARAPEPGDANVHLVLRGGVGRIVVEALSQDGSYRNYLELEAAVIGPDGQPIEANLTQTGAGRYEGRFEASVPGPYLVTVREGEELVGGAGVLRPAGDELRGEGTDRALLGRLAALGGGVVRDDLSAVFEDRPPATWAYDPLWQRLLMASLCLLLLSVALRRLILPTAWLMRLLPAPLRRRLGGGAEGGAARGASSERGRSLEALEALAARRGGGAGPEPAAPLAEELRAALAPLGRGSERAEPPEPAPAAATGEPPPAPAEGAQPPTSLAEQLLARKRKRP